MKAGGSTLRKLATLDGVHDRETVRALGVIDDDVSYEEGLPPAAASGPRRATLSDLVTQTFFAEGNRQEEVGVFTESADVRIHSLDRVPHRRGPALVVFCVLLAAAAGGAWWMGLRPPVEWQRSPLWQTLHLPKI